MSRMMVVPPAAQAVRIPVPDVVLAGAIVVPANARGIVLFVQDGESSRTNPRNQRVADRLQCGGFATLLLDLLSNEERVADAATGHLRADIELLAERIACATDWILSQPTTRDLAINYIGDGAGVAAALVAAGMRPGLVRAIVSLSGRPDLATRHLDRVGAPTQFIVGGYDTRALAINRSALMQLGSIIKDLVIVPRATRLFEEPGALDEVARLAHAWFSWYGTDACFATADVHHLTTT